MGSAIRQFGSSLEGFSKALKSNKALQGIAQKILEATKGASGLISKALANLKTSSPKIYSFISTPLNAIGSFITKIVKLLSSGYKGTVNAISKPGNVIKSALGGGKLGSGVKAAVNATVVLGGVGAYSQGQKNKYEKYLKDALGNPNVESQYNYNEL